MSAPHPEPERLRCIAAAFRTLDTEGHRITIDFLRQALGQGIIDLEPRAAHRRAPSQTRPDEQPRRRSQPRQRLPYTRTRRRAPRKENDE